MKIEIYSEGMEKKVFESIADTSRKCGIKP